jgi:hypothetical protein
MHTSDFYAPIYCLIKTQSVYCFKKMKDKPWRRGLVGGIVSSCHLGNRSYGSWDRIPPYVGWSLKKWRSQVLCMKQLQWLQRRHRCTFIFFAGISAFWYVVGTKKNLATLWWTTLGALIKSKFLDDMTPLIDCYEMRFDWTRFSFVQSWAWPRPARLFFPTRRRGIQSRKISPKRPSSAWPLSPDSKK